MDQLQLEQAAANAIKSARDDLLAFALMVRPDFVVGPHHRIIADHLKMVWNGNIRRLMLFMPPRSSKSMMTSTLFPAWCIGHSPAWHTICASHSANLAEDFSREVRNIVSSDIYRYIFPKVDLRQDSRAANRWHTTYSGVYTALGVGGHVAGRGAHLALLDDPISEQDAYSKTKRERVNNWYPSGLRTRLMPGGRVILTMTRWNVGDLAGSLLEHERNNPDADEWTVLKFPAIVNEEEAEMLNHARSRLILQGVLPEYYPEVKAGGTYWPPLEGYGDSDKGLIGWSTKELLATKANTPPHEWEAVYMQRPTLEEGNILKSSWWKRWPNEKPPACRYVFMSMDTAYSTKEQADYSAITTWGVFTNEYEDPPQPNLMLLGAQKGRWDFPELRKRTMDLYRFYQPDVILIEKKASGQSLIQELRAIGIPVMEYNPDKDKVARAYAASPMFHAERVWAPKKKIWADEVIHECAAFPTGAHDDYVDTVTQAVLWTKQGAWVITPEEDWLYNDGRDRIETNRTYY